MGIKLDDIENAFLYANAGSEFSGTAIICKKTGKIYYSSQYDDEEEIPRHVYEDDDCIELPHKNDLDVGKYLVFEFVEQNMPELVETVEQIFRKRGAYTRYKDLLTEKGQLQNWYDFESKREIQALRKWCANNNIELDA